MYKPAYMLKNVVVFIIFAAFCGCDNIPIPESGNTSTDADIAYNAAITDSLSVNNLVSGGLDRLDSAWAQIAAEAGWSNSNSFVKETELKKNVVQLLYAAKEDWIKLYDITVAESKIKAGKAMKQRIETEKQFAHNFINAMLNIAKNTNPLITQADINSVSATGEAFIGMMMEIANNETGYNTSGGLKKNEQGVYELLHYRDRLMKLIINAKRKFEAQNNTQLSSSILFTSIE
jgi:hypothetical protein